MKKVERPDFVEEEHLIFLDELRGSGEVNMYGAKPYLVDEFCLENREAGNLLTYWMGSFDERHPVE